MSGDAWVTPDGEPCRLARGDTYSEGAVIYLPDGAVLLGPVIDWNAGRNMVLHRAMRYYVADGRFEATTRQRSSDMSSPLNARRRAARREAGGVADALTMRPCSPMREHAAADTGDDCRRFSAGELVPAAACSGLDCRRRLAEPLT